MEFILVIIAVAIMLSPLFVEMYYARQNFNEFEAWRKEFQNRR